MGPVDASIFRPEAVRRYVESRAKAVLPQVVTPHILISIWILLGTLIIGGAAAGLVRVPSYSTGAAMIVAESERSSTPSHAVVIVAFLPTSDLSRLRAGQTLFLKISPSAERQRAEILSIEPEVSSPFAVRQRFGLTAQDGALVRRPVAIVHARPQGTLRGLPISKYAGSIGEAEVELGSRRLSSLLPLIGHFFRDQ